MRTHVLVLGAGYAGVMAANRLVQRDDVDVTLVIPRGHFVERIRLHQLAAGTRDAVQHFEDVLADRVRLVVAEATAIDVDARVVTLAGATTLAYDYLVYAVGSRAADGGVPGVAEHALPVCTYEDAQRLRRALGDDPDAPVVVVGGGPTGLETATELAERGRAVTWVTGRVAAPYFRDGARRVTLRRLAELGVTVRDGVHVERVTADGVELDDATVVPGLTVWAAGFRPSGLAAASGLRTDGEGRLLTDETLTSVDSVRVVAAGDAASPSGVPQRMSCQAALPLGLRAAQTVLARIAGTTPAPLANPFFGECVSLGRSGAVVQLSRTDDVAVGAHVGGALAVRIKESVCRSTVWALAREARKPGSIWFPPSKGRTRVLAEAGVTAWPARVMVDA